MIGFFIGLAVAVAVCAIYVCAAAKRRKRDLISLCKKISTMQTKDAAGSGTVVPPELSRVYSELSALDGRIRSAEEEKNSLIASVCHDIRNPLTALKGTADCIANGLFDEKETREALASASLEIDRLNRMLTSMMDVIKMKEGRFSFNMSELDVCETARRVLLSLSGEGEKKSLDVSFDAPERLNVIGDPDAIYRVLYNIMHNAVKFSYEGGRLCIGIERTEDGNKALVSVFNEGVGMSDYETARVYGKYVKGNDKSNKNGVGLGMYITKSILDAHSQQIFAESKMGEWCRFSFTLDLADGERTTKGGIPNG